MIAHVACAHFLSNLGIEKYALFGNPLELKLSIFLTYLEIILNKMHASRCYIFNEVKNKSGARPEICSGQGRSGKIRAFR